MKKYTNYKVTFELAGKKYEGIEPPKHCGDPCELCAFDSDKPDAELCSDSPSCDGVYFKEVTE